MKFNLKIKVANLRSLKSGSFKKSQKWILRNLKSGEFKES